MKLTHRFVAFAAAAFFALTAPAMAAQVSDLVAALKSTDRKQVADACRELGRIGTPEAIAPLAALLPDENLNHMARYALEPIPSPEVDKALRDALPKLSGRPLAGAITSLGVRRDAKAVKPLAEFLRNSNQDVAQAAARALGDIGTPDAAEVLQKQLSASAPLAVYEGLLRAAERLQLDGKNRQAKDIFASLQKAQAPHQVRAAGLRGLIQAPGDNGTGALKDALKGADYTQFAVAVRAAQELASPAFTKVLAEELSKLTPDRQVVVLQTLGMKADPVTLPAVMTASRSPDKQVKIAAIRALPQFENPTVGPQLVDTMFDADKDVARAAQEAVAGIPGRDTDAALIALLSGGNKQQKLAGIDLVTRRRMAATLPELSRLATDADAQVRTAAFKSIGELGGTAQLPFLLERLQQAKEAQDLESAASALEVVAVKPGNREAAVSAVQGRLAGSQPEQKTSLLRVLTTVGGPEALTSVRGALQDSNPEVRSAAVRALTGWSTPDAAADLLQIARSSSSNTEKTVALRGYLAMAARGDIPEPQRIEMCKQAAALVERPEEKRLLLSALGAITSPDSVQLLKSYLDDPAVRDEAGTAALTIADKLLQRDNAAQLAKGLVEPLEKIAGNEKLAERAKKLLEQARAKAQ